MMESVQQWGAAKGLDIEPYGLDIVPEFVERARQRLPHWAHRISTGNIRTWNPPGEKFDYAMIRPEYAPPGKRVELILHMLHNVVKPGGRLIVFVGSEEADNRSVERSMTSEGINVHGRVEKPHPKDIRLVRRLFWIDNLNGKDENQNL
jgi:trans-aconitate methyltransferase